LGPPPVGGPPQGGPFGPAGGPTPSFLTLFFIARLWCWGVGGGGGGRARARAEDHLI